MSTPAREPPSVRSTTSAARRAIAAAAEASNARALVPRGEILGKSILRRRILHEDDYVEALERIIARDFFPDVELARELAEHAAAERAETEGTPWRDTDRMTLDTGFTGRDLGATPFATDAGETPLRSTIAGPSTRPRQPDVSFAKQLADEARSLDSFLSRCAEKIA